MEIQMDRDERLLFESLLNCSSRYLEFGAGGSTCLAASSKKEWIISVDSSADWLRRVGTECASDIFPTKPTLIHADIGELGDWGAPKDYSMRSVWPDYHRAVWSEPRSRDADLFLVDGRFRVACFMQCLLNGTGEMLIAIHDFANREYYHPVKMVAKEIAKTKNLSVFIKPHSFDANLAQQILAEHNSDPR